MKDSIRSVCRLVCAAAVTLFAGVAFSDTVPTDGLLAAVAAAQDGATLELGVGTYEINGEILLTNSVTIIGAGIGQTIIRQKATNKRIIILDNENARVEGCTITGANLTSEINNSGNKSQYDGHAWGVAVTLTEKGGTLYNCRVTGNRTSCNHNACVGVYSKGAKGVISHCQIDDNKTTGGTNNTYGGVRLSGGTMDYCLVFDNKGHQVGGLGAGVCTVSNCTFYANETTQSDGGNVLLENDSAVFTDCIFAAGVCPSDRSAANLPEWSGNKTPTFNRCSFPTGVALGANWKGSAFNADPIFADVANRDYTQPLRSPTRDIGCYAPYDYSVLACDLRVGAVDIAVNGSVEFIPTISGCDEDDAVSYTWTVTKPDSTTETLTEAYPTYSPTTAGAYSVTLSIAKNEGMPVAAPGAATFMAVDLNVAVSTSAELVAALEHALEGLVISLEAKTYEITKTLTLGKGITIRGAGRGKTFIRQKTTSERVVYLNHPSDLVEDVTLVGTKMNAEKLHGIVACIFTEGGTIRNCDITGGNKAAGNWTHGLGVAMFGPGLVDHCVISNNVRTIGTNMYGGGAYMEDGTLDTCLICNNYTHQGGGIYATSAKCKVYNCTVVDNKVTASGGGLYASSGTYVNSLFARNTSTDTTATDTTKEYFGSAGATFTRCMWPEKVSSAALGSDCVFADAIFVDADHADYHIQSSSKSKDAGSAYVGLPETDLDGAPRISGKGSDIGCYEFDSANFSCAFDNAPKVGFVGATSLFTAAPDGLEPGATVLCKWTVTDPSGKATTVVTSDLVMTLEGSVAGKYYVSLTAESDGVESEPFAPVNASFTVSPTNFFVKPATAANAVKAEFPYDTWETAATNLLDVLPWVLDSAAIYLDEGEITVADRVDLVNEVTLVGKGWEKTTLRQTAKTKSVLRLDHENALARGVTITGFDAQSEIHSRGAVMIENKGGTVEDCRITANKYTGNGMINQACGIGITLNSTKAVCRRCIIDRNCGSNGTNNDRGGGVQGLAGLLENCLVCCNTNKHAGGIYVNTGSSFTIRNCTVYGNVGIGVDSGDYGHYGVGGLGVGGGKAIVENTIIFGNTSPNQGWSTGGYPEWRVSGGSVEFTNCMLPEGIGWPANATDCLNGDPLFKDVAADDFHLTSHSPAAYKGDRLDYTAESTDLDGKPRIFNFRFPKAKPDLGCYESPYGAPGLMLLVR